MRRGWAAAFLLASTPALADDSAPGPNPLPPVTSNFPEPFLLNIPAMSSGLVFDVRLDRTDYVDESDPNTISLVPSAQYIDASGLGGWRDRGRRCPDARKRGRVR